MEEENVDETNYVRLEDVVRNSDDLLSVATLIRSMEFSIPPIASFDCDTLKVYRKEEQWIDDWLECVWNMAKVSTP